MEYAETSINNLLDNNLNENINKSLDKPLYEKITPSILKLCKFQPYTVAGLHHYFNNVKKITVSYSTVYRTVLDLENKNFLHADYGGMFYTTEQGNRFLLDNLHSKTSTIQNAQNKNNWAGFNDKKNWLLKKMRKLVNENMTFNYEDEAERIKRYDLNYLFVEYLKDINDKVLILKKTHRPTNTSEYLILPYTTRFTDKKAIVKKLKDFDRRFNYFSKRHDKAVFLTLTTDPKRFNNLNEACENIGKAFKKLMDYLNRRHKAENGGKLEYIAGFEFSPKKALPHLHVVIFGVDYLDLGDNRKKNDNSKARYKSVYKLSEMWDRYGQGTQVFIYGIKKTKDGQKWIYKDSRKKPKDAKKNDVAYYLKKYLVKTFYALRDIQNKLNYLNELHKEFNLKNPAQREKFKEKKKELITEIYKKLGTIPFYLATNKRFFTSSKVPAYKPEVKEENTEYEYKIIGSFYYFDIPAFVLNHNQNQKKRSYTAIDYGSHTVYNSSSLGAW
jgi:hypothetical protein